MSRTGAFLLGALGGLLPIVVSLLTIDLAPIIDHPESLSIGNYVGYAIRVAVLIVLGGTMALLNNEVKQPFSIVQLGIAAPALVTSFVNGATANAALPAHAYLSIISQAQAHAETSGRRFRVAGNFISDVTAGLTNRLDTLAIQKRAGASPEAQGPQGSRSITYPATSAAANPQAGPPAPQGYGSFCITAVGRFQGPANPIGAPCNVPTQSGPTHGFVGQ